MAEEKTGTIEAVAPHPGESAAATVPNAAPATPPSKRDEYLDYLLDRYPDRFQKDDEDSVFGFLSEKTKGDDAAEDRLAEALSADPRLAQILSDVLNKKRNAPAAFARYFGKDFLNAEEGTAEYDEIEAAESERMAELEEGKTAKAEYDKNIEASAPLLDEFAKENKLDIQAFLDKVYDQIIEPIFDGNYTKELLTMLNNALNYATDVEQAMKAGQVQARNERIEQMHREPGDGMPSLGGSAGATEKKQPQIKRNFNVKNESVWDD